MTVRIPKYLANKISQISKAKRMSQNATILSLIRQALTPDDQEQIESTIQSLDLPIGDSDLHDFEAPLED